MSKGRDPNSLEEKQKQIREGVGYDSDNENEPDYEATGGGANEQKEEKKESPAKASLSDVFQKISIPKHITTQTSQKTKDNDWDDIEEIQLPPETPSKEKGTKEIGKVKIPSASDKVEGQLSLQEMLAKRVEKTSPANITHSQQPTVTPGEPVVVSSNAPPPPLAVSTQEAERKESVKLFEKRTSFEESTVIPGVNLNLISTKPTPQTDLNNEIIIGKDAPLPPPLTSEIKPIPRSGTKNSPSPNLKQESVSPDSDSPRPQISLKDFAKRSSNYKKQTNDSKDAITQNSQTTKQGQASILNNSDLSSVELTNAESTQSEKLTTSSNGSKDIEQKSEFFFPETLSRQNQSPREAAFEEQARQFEKTQTREVQNVATAVKNVEKTSSDKTNKGVLNILKEIYKTENTFINNMKEFVTIIKHIGLRENLSQKKEKKFNKYQFDLIINRYKKLAELDPLPGGMDKNPTVANLIPGMRTDNENFAIRQQLIREITINYDDDIKFLNELRNLKKVKNNPKAMQFFNGSLKQADVFPEKNINPSAIVNQLGTYLIQPVQRAPRYHLLLKQLGAKLSLDDPELPNVIKARDEIGIYLTETNEIMNENVCKNLKSEIVEKFENKRNSLKKEDKKLIPISNLILNIFLSENLKEIKAHLESASKNKTLMSSRGVRESTTSTLINKYLTRVNESLLDQSATDRPKVQLSKTQIELQPPIITTPNTLSSIPSMPPQQQDVNKDPTPTLTSLPPLLSQLKPGAYLEPNKKETPVYNREALNKLLANKDKVFLFKKYEENLNLVYTFNLTDQLGEVFQDKEQFNELLTALGIEKDEAKRQEIREITDTFLTEKASQKVTATIPRAPFENKSLKNYDEKKQAVIIESANLIESAKNAENSVSIANKKVAPPPIPADLADELERKHPGIKFPSGRKYADSVKSQMGPPPLLSETNKGLTSFIAPPVKNSIKEESLEKILRIKGEIFLFKNPTLNDKLILILTFNLTNELREILSDAQQFNTLMDELEIKGDDRQTFRDLATKELEIPSHQISGKPDRKIPDEIKELLTLSEKKISLCKRMLETANKGENRDEDNTALDNLITVINGLATKIGFKDEEELDDTPDSEEELDGIPHPYDGERSIFEKNELESNKILKRIEKIWHRAKPVPPVQSQEVDKSKLISPHNQEGNTAFFKKQIPRTEETSASKNQNPNDKKTTNYTLFNLPEDKNEREAFVDTIPMNAQFFSETVNALREKDKTEPGKEYLLDFLRPVSDKKLIEIGQSIQTQKELDQFIECLNAEWRGPLLKFMQEDLKVSLDVNMLRRSFASFAPDTNGYCYRNKPPLPTMLQPNLSFEVPPNIMPDLSDGKSNDRFLYLKKHSELSDLLQTMDVNERLEFFKKIPQNKLEEIIGNAVTLSLFLKTQFEAKNYKIIKMIQPTFILKSLQTRVEGLRFLLEFIPEVERQNIFNSIQDGFINAYITDPERMTSFINVLFKYDLNNNFLQDKDKIRSIINNETDLEIAFTQASIETQKIFINALDNKIVDILSTAGNADTIANIFIHLPKDYRQRVTKKMGENWLQEITLNITDDKLAAKFQAFIPTLTKSTTLPDDPYNFSSLKKLQNYHKGLSMLRTSQENISQPKFQLTEEESRRARITSSGLGPSPSDRINLVLSEKVNKKQMSFDFEAILSGLSLAERKTAIRMIASIIRQDHEINNLSFNLTQMTDAEIKLIAESFKYRDDNNFPIYNLHLFNGDGIQLRDVTKWVDALSILPNRVDRIGIQFSISEVEKDLMRNDVYRFKEGNADYEKILAYSRLSRADGESQQFMKHYKDLLSEKDLKRPRPLEIPNNHSTHLRVREAFRSPLSSVSSSSELLSPASTSFTESLTHSPVSRESLNYATTDSESSDSEFSPVHEPMSPLTPSSDEKALDLGESIEAQWELLKDFVEAVKKENEQSKFAFNADTPLTKAIKEIDELKLRESNGELNSEDIQKLILDVANILSSLQKPGITLLSKGNLTNIAKEYEKEIQKFITPPVSPKQIM